MCQSAGDWRSSTLRLPPWSSCRYRSLPTDSTLAGSTTPWTIPWRRRRTISPASWWPVGRTVIRCRYRTPSQVFSLGFMTALVHSWAPHCHQSRRLQGVKPRAAVHLIRP